MPGLTAFTKVTAVRRSLARRWKTRPPWELPTRLRTPPPAVTHINLALTWFEDLKARVPATGQVK